MALKFFLCLKRAGFVAIVNGSKKSVRTGSDALLGWQFCWVTLQCFVADVALAVTQPKWSSMSLNELIAQLQQIRAAHGGDLQVWVLDRSPVGPRAYLGEMNPPDFRSPPEKVVFVE